MKLAVFSHKVCWPSGDSATGYATDGGFPFQMAALCELFDETVLLVPCSSGKSRTGEIPLTGSRIRVSALPLPYGAGFSRKLLFPLWLLRCAPIIFKEFCWADAVHTPIPGDVGTVGMLLGWLFHKPLFVRHCGNWLRPATVAEKFWRWFMEAFAGGRNVMLATGGTAEPPSRKNPNIRWIFSTSLTKEELLVHRSGQGYPADGQLKLIIVARQERAKGAGTIIQALPRLAKRHPGVRLEIVGEGSAIPEFKQAAHDLGVADRVSFSGKLNHEQVLQRLVASHLFVFPTTSSDGFPKAVLEALACGLPVVGTRVSVLPQLLGSGCGVLIDEATPGVIVGAIEAAVEDSNRFKGMANRAVETARQYSLESWRDTIGRYLCSEWGPLRAKK